MQNKVEKNDYLSQTATYMTDLSNNYVDWHNVAGLARARMQKSITGLWTHYSWRELFIRGGMIVATALAATYGGMPSKEEERFSYKAALAYGLTTFTITHAVAVIPTLKRRFAIGKQINVLETNIHDQITQIGRLENGSKLMMLLNEKIDVLHKFNFKSLKRGDAASNLIRKKHLLTAAKDSIEEVISGDSTIEQTLSFWQQDIPKLIDALEKNESQSQIQNTTSNSLR